MVPNLVVLRCRLVSQEGFLNHIILAHQLRIIILFRHLHRLTSIILLVSQHNKPSW